MALHIGTMSKVIAILLIFAVCEGHRLRGFGSFTTRWQDTRNETVVGDQWFIQKLDHFNGADSRTWKQRYFVKEQFYRDGGPVFLMIGGEGPANPAWMENGTWLLYAQQMGALCLMLEHRFYGQSHPTVCWWMTPAGRLDCS
ncbi:unnamed protein product [Boreogadus saida]